VTSPERAPSKTLRIRIDPAVDEYRLGLLSVSADPYGANEGVETGISNAVFYCISEDPAAPGERLRCEISIAGISGYSPEKSPIFRCWVKVLRLALRGLEPGFRIIFQFEAREVTVA
jgi:hypothetical protein